MFTESHLLAVHGARSAINHALTALAHSHCAHWQGASANAAEQNLAQLVIQGNHLYQELYTVGLQIEEILDLQRAADCELALAGVA